MTMEAWAIEGVHGLYYGTYPTRAEAIADHVRCICDINLPRFQFGPLTTQQKRYWDKRRKAGDRAVRVAVTKRKG